MANPDGYDYTFTEGQRLWRKNLRDNDGDGQITDADGVDLNRNFDYRWGYDNEGSSPDPTSLTYRGPSRTPSPRHKALEALVKRIGFEFFVNYHSAAELLLYGIGLAGRDAVARTTSSARRWPATTRTPPSRAMTRTSPPSCTRPTATPTRYMTEKYGAFGFTPEMSTCEAASDVRARTTSGRPRTAAAASSSPTTRALVEAEFRRNIPFALAVAESASDPDDPVSVVGREARGLPPRHVRASPTATRRPSR